MRVFVRFLCRFSVCGVLCVEEVSTGVWAAAAEPKPHALRHSLLCGHGLVSRFWLSEPCGYVLQFVPQSLLLAGLCVFAFGLSLSGLCVLLGAGAGV
jgi:hypothetical protein